MEIVLTRREFDKLRTPCVYILTRNGAVLYVGASKNGYKRILTEDRTFVRRQAFMSFDSVRIIFYRTHDEAFQAEKRLIHEHHPPGQLCAGCGKTPYSDPIEEFFDEE